MVILFLNVSYIYSSLAVGDRMFLGCKILIFAQTESNFAQILSNLPKFYPNLPKFA